MQLTFTMDLPAKHTTHLVLGKLKLSYDQTNILFQATSGIPLWQFQGAWKFPRKGVLPPSNKINAKYSVETEKLWLPHVKGVEGSFYKILPFNVVADKVSRSDLGIHFDANVVGSAGCIVLSGAHKQEHWDIFRKHMGVIASKGVKAVPLEVIYN